MIHVDACMFSQFVCFCPTGILTQLVSDDVMKPFGRTYIPASYVKYIESGGSRVMPIRWVESYTILGDCDVLQKQKFTIGVNVSGALRSMCRKFIYLHSQNIHINTSEWTY